MDNREIIDRLLRAFAPREAGSAAGGSKEGPSAIIVVLGDASAGQPEDLPATVDQERPAEDVASHTANAFSDFTFQPLHRVTDAEPPGLAAEGSADTEVAPSEGAHRKEQLERLIQDLSPDLDIPTPTEVLQGRRNAEARALLLTEFGGLTSAQVADIMGSEARNRASVAQRLKKDGRLLGVTYKGTTWYPGFPFYDGDLLPVIADVLAAFEGGVLNEWETALWFTSSNGWLDDKRPVDVLVEQPAAVVEAARLEVTGFGG